MGVAARASVSARPAAKASPAPATPKPATSAAKPSPTPTTPPKSAAMETPGPAATAKTITVNKETTVNHGYHNSGGDSGNGFFMGWLMGRSSAPAAPVVVAGTQQAAPVAPIQYEREDSGVGVFGWLVIISLIAGGAYLWLRRGRDA